MNHQIWDLYKCSDRGKRMIDLFDSSIDKDLINPNMLREFLRASESQIEDTLDFLALVFLNAIVDNLVFDASQGGEEIYTSFIEQIEICDICYNEEENKYYKIPNVIFIKQDDYRTKCANIDSISLFLYYQFPDFFKPVLYSDRFDIIMKSCDILGIEIPPLPSSIDKKKRLMYYWILCDAFNKFQKDNNLSNAEFCACFYDYSQMLINKKNELAELPEPTNIWLTGASKEDYEFLENADDMTKSTWACNQHTRRGDIIIIYCLAPHSKIHSIWRAETDGVANPFSYYYNRITVCNGIKVPSLTFKELKTDDYFSQLSIVRRNLQGVNGISFSTRDYKELLRLIKAKGFNIDLLPSVYAAKFETYQNIKNEKDVEEKLLIPLLKELGYTEADWTRQLSQKAGRNLKAIPDFVFFPKGQIHFQYSPLIIEAKYNMSSPQERLATFNQAYSYARMMQSKYLGICDKERIVIYKKNEDFIFDRFNPIFEKHWGSVKNPETFSELRKIIGSSVLKEN